ncbi:MAG: UTP--glucose-1-phosphate uridylyltransferase [Candidatus Thermoplasmatota archaeon]|jgi:UTP--glucose-1-phosphate uridylyltransferase|nr:UTP--glucose-1-phosphate uridylyltransferase [Candidatus Thermoplasmatota archaeon]
MKAVIPAAGLGTRLLPVSKAQPKEMMPVLNKPAIQYVVEEASSGGFHKVLIITNRNKKVMEDHFDRNLELENLLRKKGATEALKELERIEGLADLFYLRQKEQRGLGDAVLCSESFVGEGTFAVLLGDDIIISEVPAIRQLYEAHLKVKAPVVALEEVPLDKVERYGIVDTDKEISPGLFKLKGIVEKPKRDNAPSRMAVMGRYILDSDIFGWLRESPTGVGGELQLTDSLARYIGTKGLYGLVVKGLRVDIGSVEDWLKANIQVALLDPELKKKVRDYIDSLMKEGKL